MAPTRARACGSLRPVVLLVPSGVSDALGPLSRRAYRFVLFAAVAIGEDLSELRAEQENLDRIIDPQQQNDEAAGGAVARRDGAAAEVPADQALANGEQNRRHDGADNDVPPLQAPVGQHLVDGRE